MRRGEALFLKVLLLVSGYSAGLGEFALSHGMASPSRRPAPQADGVASAWGSRSSTKLAPGVNHIPISPDVAQRSRPYYNPGTTLPGEEHVSHLEEEIAEQPAVLERLLREEGRNVHDIARAIRQREPRFVYVAARGTSDHAGTYGKYLLASACSLPVALATPSLFTIYGKPPCLRGALVLGISQSGHSPDIVEVVAEGRRQGAVTLGITNNPDSPLAAAAEFTLPVHAGEEHAVAATKTYTAQLTALALLAVALAGDSSLWADLERLPEHMARALELSGQALGRVERYRYMERCVLIGRGYNYATALEIALKLKELTYVVAEPYSSADFRHGPIAIIEQGFPVILVAPHGAVYHDLMALALDLRAREAELVVISDEPEALGLAQTPFPLPAQVPEWLSPIVAVVAGQRFAAALTKAKGYDLDQPRGLRKVTRTT